MANEQGEQAGESKSEVAPAAQAPAAETPPAPAAEAPAADPVKGVPELTAEVEQLTTLLESEKKENAELTAAWKEAEDDFEKAKDANAELTAKVSALEASNADLTSKLATADDMVATLKRRTAVGPATVDEAREILAEAERLEAEEEAARPKRYYAVGVIRDDAGAIQPGTDVSTKFSKADLEALVSAGAVELR